MAAAVTNAWTTTRASTVKITLSVSPLRNE
jgi:hypothetical protein